MDLLQSLALSNVCYRMRYCTASPNILLSLDHWWLDLWTPLRLSTSGDTVKDWGHGRITPFFRRTISHWVRLYHLQYMVTGPNFTGKMRCLSFQYLLCLRQLVWYKTSSSTSFPSSSYRKDSCGAKRFPNRSMRNFWIWTFPLIFNQIILVRDACYFPRCPHVPRYPKRWTG